MSGWSKSYSAFGEGGYRHQIGEAQGGGWGVTVAKDRSAYLESGRNALSFGPYTTDLVAGRYRVTFRLEVGEVRGSGAIVAWVDVHDQEAMKMLLLPQDLCRSAFPVPGHPQEFSFEFVNRFDHHRLEFRVFWHGNCDLIHHSTTLTCLQG